MGNLIRMDLYRLVRSTSFRVCAILAFVLAMAQTPLFWGLTMVTRMFSEEVSAFPKTANLTEIIGNPLPFLNGMLVMLSACSFFYADMEDGYIKNIAGQMPKRGFTVLSKYFAMIPHNLFFMLLGVIGTLIGTVFLQQIVPGGNVFDSVVIFLMKFLLLQSICTILILVTAAFRNKSLGTVLAVLFGMGLLGLVYAALSTGISQLLRMENFNLSDYMPDQLLGSADPDVVKSILVSAVTTAIFLPVSIRVFDKRDVK